MKKYDNFWYIFAFIVFVIFVWWITKPPIFDGHDSNQPEDENNMYDTLGRP